MAVSCEKRHRGLEQDQKNSNAGFGHDYFDVKARARSPALLAGDGMNLHSLLDGVVGVHNYTLTFLQTGEDFNTFPKVAADDDVLEVDRVVAVDQSD